jgi:hypothetical protein
MALTDSNKSPMCDAGQYRPAKQETYIMGRPDQTQWHAPDEKCSICGEEYEGFDNNAWPINDGRCCTRCNDERVIPTRWKMMREQDERMEARRIS